LEQLFKNSKSAKLWWKEQAHWCGVLQNMQPFRKSAKDEALYLILESDELKWQWKNEAVYPPKLGAISSAGIAIVDEENTQLAEGFSFWFDLNVQKIYAALATDFAITDEKASLHFGELRLISYNKNDINEYKYFNNFGIYQEAR